MGDHDRQQPPSQPEGPSPATDSGRHDETPAPPPTPSWEQQWAPGASQQPDTGEQRPPSTEWVVREPPTTTWDNQLAQPWGGSAQVWSQGPTSGSTSAPYGSGVSSSSTGITPPSGSTGGAPEWSSGTGGDAEQGPGRQPGYSQPGFTEPGYGQPAYGQAPVPPPAPPPTYDASAYPAPPDGAPAHGTPAYPAPPYGAPAYDPGWSPRSANASSVRTQAIVSLVINLISLSFCNALGIAGAICAGVAIGKADTDLARGRTLVRWSWGLLVAAVVIGIGLFIAFIALVASSSDSGSSYSG